MNPISCVVHRDTSATSRWLRALPFTRERVGVADLLDLADASVFAFADALLEGMGKTEARFAIKRRSEPLIAAWLINLAPFDVVIPDAQLLDPAGVIEAARWFAGYGARVWVCAATPSTQFLNEAARELEHRVTADAVAVKTAEGELRDYMDAKPPIEEVRVTRLWPRMPQVDGIVFRSTCQRLLSPEDFARVDAELVATVRQVTSALPVPFTTPARAREVYRLLRDLIRTADDPEHVILRMRAAQAVLTLRGWRMHIDTPMLVGAASVVPRLGAFEATGAWRLFDTYRDPDPGAAAALYLAGADPQFIRALSVGDVDDDDPNGALAWETDDGPIGVDHGGTRFIRTLATFRRLCGASSEDPLFVTNQALRGGSASAKPISHKLLRRLLDVPAAEIGVSPTRGKVRAHPDATQYVKHFGVTLTWLFHNARLEKEGNDAGVTA